MDGQVRESSKHSYPEFLKRVLRDDESDRVRREVVGALGPEIRVRTPERLLPPKNYGNALPCHTLGGITGSGCARL